MTDRAALDAKEIESELFSPSERYLLSLFCQPRRERRDGLEKAADWFGLNSVLSSVTPDTDLHETVENRWLDLLDACGRELSSQARKRELTALLQALRETANSEDRSATTLDQLWARTSALLLEKMPERRANSKHTGVEPATLRGRKWGALRHELADALAHRVAQATPARLVPREPRAPRMFHRATFEAIRQRLESEEPGSGLLVLDAASGSGRSELALAYAHWALNERKIYDRVFVLRATDLLRLEQDFTAMASMLAGSTKRGRTHSRAQLRRDALKDLEESDRWLLVCSAVQDPAILMQILPWRLRGHVLCTYASRPDDRRPDPWLTYFNVQPLRWENLAGAATFDARSFLSAAVPAGVDPEALDAVADVVGPSRHATSLACAWLTYTAPPPGELEPAAWGTRQLIRYRRRWERAMTLVGDGHDNELGIIAALVQLQELQEPEEPGESTPWRPRDEEQEKLETATLQLLSRLEPFVDEELAASTFQTALLDHEVYSDVDDLVHDARIELLEQLGLADRAVLVPKDKYFDINSAVLKAVEVYTALEDTRKGASASAARTMVNVLSDPPTKREVSDLTLEVLPHIDALAKREAAPDGSRWPRPLLAAELYGYSALCYLARERGRTARRQRDALAEVFRRLDEPPFDTLRIDQLESWQDLDGENPPPQSVIKRMGKLIKALRMTGFPRPAIEIFGHLEGIIRRDPTGLHLDESDREQLARLRFEAAMAYHDVDDLTRARALVEEARATWTELGGRARYVLMAESVLAELRFDEGDFAAARRSATCVLTAREQLASEPQDGRQAKAIADVARTNYLLGRIAYVEGDIELAETLFTASVDLWDKAFRIGDAETPAPCFDRINQLASRSYLALMKALLAKGRAALDEAENVLYMLEETPHRVHADAQIRANLGQAYRLCGRVIEAASLHQEAATDAARAWSRRHRFNLLVRRKQADSLLAAGRPGEALALLRELLNEATDDAPSTGAVLRRARVWSTLGRLIIESSVSAPPLLTDSDRAYLDLAQHVLTEARVLYDEATEDDAINPGTVNCVLWSTEIAIRRGDGTRAVEQGIEAVGLAKRQFGAHPPVAAAEARLIRARALDVGENRSAIADLRAEIDQLVDVVATAPADRFEIALARAEVSAREWLLDPDAAAASQVLAEIKDWLEEALEPLYASIGLSTPHQLSARMYAELAAFADRFGLPGQQRARNERERNRLRPRLAINVSELSFEIAPLLRQRSPIGAV